MKNLNEECGVFGVFAPAKSRVADTVYYGLFALQHRGQESCGIVVNDDGLFHTYKDLGLVNDVFTHDILDNLGEGNMAIGHVMYGKAGSVNRENTLPIVVNHVKGRMAISYNGSLVNATELKEELELTGAIFHTTGDTEVISYVITKERLTGPSIEQAINSTMNKIKGAYSLVVMSPSKLIAARDENGLKPLCYGKTDDGTYIVASESCALNAVGATLIRDIRPGEIVVFDDNGIRSITDHCDKKEHKLCVFEYVYFARPDSVIDGCSVHNARVKAGRFLAQEHPVEADVVIGVPDSGLDAALGYSRESGIEYGIGFLKNKYIGRTFIAPGQKSREDLVRIKLNPIIETVKGKRVVLIDDSIVRGTTSARIVKLLRDAGATEVHMRVTAPPFINVCYYGTDIDSKERLIANNHSIKEIEKLIGVDSLGFLSLESTVKIGDSGDGKGYCLGCFTGEYPTEVPKCNRKSIYEMKKSDRENFKK